VYKENNSKITAKISQLFIAATVKVNKCILVKMIEKWHYFHIK